MNLTHRPVEEKDLPLICSFPKNAAELFYMFPAATYPLTVEQLEQAISERSDSTVVQRDGKVVGFANFYLWEKGGTCSIGNVIVAPSARGRGVGRYLMKVMLDIAYEKHQASEVTLSCFNDNIDGLLFYPPLGFEPYSIEERPDWKGRRKVLINMRHKREKRSVY
jgi:ribosomal protein S18 acetylase RimI-like enzyme